MPGARDDTKKAGRNLCLVLGVLASWRLISAFDLPRMVPGMEYRVELPVYNGPLDLLLYLIKRDELDIYDIPIARITDSYMSYLKVLRELRAEHGVDINVAGDFLVMAATLMEIKSAMLLPRQPSEQTQEGDRKSTR